MSPEELQTLFEQFFAHFPDSTRQPPASKAAVAALERVTITTGGMRSHLVDDFCRYEAQVCHLHGRVRVLGRMPAHAVQPSVPPRVSVAVAGADELVSAVQTRTEDGRRRVRGAKVGERTREATRRNAGRIARLDVQLSASRGCDTS